jgi:hypothetical protein
MTFDGAADYVTTPFGNGLNVFNRTYSAWVKTAAPTVNKAALTQSLSTNNRRAYFGHNGAAGRWAISIQSTTTSDASVQDGPSDTEWRLLARVRQSCAPFARKTLQINEGA